MASSIGGRMTVERAMAGSVGHDGLVTVWTTTGSFTGRLRNVDDHLVILTVESGLAKASGEVFITTGSVVAFQPLHNQ